MLVLLPMDSTGTNFAANVDSPGDNTTQLKQVLVSTAQRMRAEKNVHGAANEFVHTAADTLDRTATIHHMRMACILTGASKKNSKLQLFKQI